MAERCKYQKTIFTAEDRIINGSGPAVRSIHEYIVGLVLAEFDAVFYDHRSLEIADILAFKRNSVLSL